MEPLRTGPWRLSDIPLSAPDAPIVFSCFHGGGGSSMGYKLAGFNVLGGVEVDPDMMRLYKTNLHPEHSFEMGVETFNSMYRVAGPQRMKPRIDILDGSPPCSSFSMAGNREKDWGKKKVFREGQADQVLDDLFFHFLETARLLKPRIVVAENVRGLIQGSARGYVKQIFSTFRSYGYICQLFLLNSSRMGVPQARERTFFLAHHESLALPKISLSFNESPIPLSAALAGADPSGATKLPPSLLRDFYRIKAAGQSGRKYQSTSIASPASPCSTVTSKICIAAGSVMHWEGRKFSPAEVIRIQSFPEDYDFCGLEPGYVMGMSVPPLMMQRVATEIARQWISVLRARSAVL